jgi:PhoH-like ATPase
VASTFVLDTCVLLADPHSPLRFHEHDVVLPLVVIEELDRKKTRMDEVGANARSAIRLLEELGASKSGGMREPARLPGGGTLRIELNGVYSDRLPSVLDPGTPDHRILSTCLNLQESTGAVLVTKDASLRIKGAQLGVRVQDYRADTARTDQLRSGVIEHQVPGEVIDRLYDEGKLEVDEVEAPLNEFVVLRNGSSRSALARVVQADPVTVLERMPTHVRAFGIEPKNLQQTVALEQVLEQGRYRRVSVYRPLVAVGRQELGFLPGDLNEKLAPWMAAVHDNLYALFSDAGVDGARHAIDELIERGELEMASVTYLRGRSITGEFVIIDEAQNLELSTLKVILTRMSRDSKVVFCGDLTQVDNPYISPYGGMAALIEKFTGSGLFAHVTLERSVRSPLAEMAATIL